MNRLHKLYMFLCCSCFMLQQPLMGKIFKTLGKGVETMEINQNDKMTMVRQRYQLIHSSNTDYHRVLESDWIRATPRQTQLTVMVLDAIFTCWLSLCKRHQRHQMGLSTDIADQRILQSVWTRVISGHVHKW